jgi:hypothetical protein
LCVPILGIVQLGEARTLLESRAINYGLPRVIEASVSLLAAALLTVVCFVAVRRLG